MVWVSQADVREGLAAVCRFVDAVAERRGLPVIRFAGADVHDVRIRRVDGNVADGGRAVRLENRIEGRAVVDRFEDTAHGVADIDDVRIAFADRDVVDAAAHAGGAYRSKPERREQRVRWQIDHARCGRAPLLRLHGGHEQRQGDETQRQRESTEATGDPARRARLQTCRRYEIHGGDSTRTASQGLIQKRVRPQTSSDATHDG